MLRNTVIAACLLSASGSVLAVDEHVSRHGERHAPRVSITLGGGHHNDSYREAPHHDVYVARPVHVQPVYHNTYYYRQHGGGHHRWQNKHHGGWRDYDRDDHRDRRRHHEDDDD